MDDINEILVDTTTRLYGDLFPENSVPDLANWNGEAWRAVAETGLPLALLDERDGGFGIDGPTALTLLRLASRSTGALPLGETMLANFVLSRSGLAVAQGVATVAAADETGALSLVQQDEETYTLSGTVTGVPWGRQAECAALVLSQDGETWVIRVPASGWIASRGDNLARLPRDRLDINVTLPISAVRRAGNAWSVDRLRATGAAIRVQEIAGALDAVLDRTVRYANERVQFGRPIGKQQAVQQQVAVLAGHVVAAGAAASIAADAFDRPDGLHAIAAAKIRAGEAAGAAAAIAHQVHGAIGFTGEHALHVFTKRLWAWRDEFGSERVWSRRLGQWALEAGPDGFWPLVTALGESKAA